MFLHTKDRGKVHSSLHQKFEYMALLSLLMPISFQNCKCSMNSCPYCLPCIFTQTYTLTPHPLSPTTNFKCEQTSCCQLLICTAMSARISKYEISVVLGFELVRKKTITCLKEFQGCSYALLTLQNLPGSQQKNQLLIS